MAKSRKGSKVQQTLSILAYGDAGTWKSSLGCESIALKNPDGTPMRVLVLDAEFGGVNTALERVAEAHDVDLDNTYVIYTESYTEIMQILDKVKNNEDFYEYDEDGEETNEVILDANGNPFRADFIVLDGSTVIYNASAIALTKFSEVRAKVKAKVQGKNAEETRVSVQGAGLELKDYNKLNKERSQELILKLISTGKHHYITAREVDEKQTVKGDDGKFQSVATGKKIPEGFKGLTYNVGAVFHNVINEFGQVNVVVENKDRTGLYPQNYIIEEPSLLAYQSIIDGNKGKKAVSVEPSFAKSIEKEFDRELEENDEVKTVVSGKDLTEEQYHALIKEQIDKLTAQDKKALAPKLQKVGLTPKYVGLELSQLKQFLEIISK